MRTAFTLIELLAVIVIVGIISATAVPAITSLGNTQRSAAVQQLIRDLTFARQHAQGTGTTVWVVFSIDSQQWQLLREDPNNPGRVNAAPMMNPATGSAYKTMLDTGSFASASLAVVNFGGGQEVGFDWMGKPLIGDDQMLTGEGLVTFSGGREVRVEAGTGFIQ